jgi:hypothetical protein
MIALESAPGISSQILRGVQITISSGVAAAVREL